MSNLTNFFNRSEKLCALLTNPLLTSFLVMLGLRSHLRMVFDDHLLPGPAMDEVDYRSRATRELDESAHKNGLGHKVASPIQYGRNARPLPMPTPGSTNLRQLSLNTALRTFMLCIFTWTPYTSGVMLSMPAHPLSVDASHHGFGAISFCLAKAHTPRVCLAITDGFLLLLLGAADLVINDLVRPSLHD